VRLSRWGWWNRITELIIIWSQMGLSKNILTGQGDKVMANVTKVKKGRITKVEINGLEYILNVSNQFRGGKK